MKKLRFKNGSAREASNGRTIPDTERRKDSQEQDEEPGIVDGRKVSQHDTIKGLKGKSRKRPSRSKR
jgi:hypothetical protein